jgi:hypothetical protein
MQDMLPLKFSLQPPCHGSHVPHSGTTVTRRNIPLRHHPWEAHQSLVALRWPSSNEGPPLRDVLKQATGNVKRKMGVDSYFSDVRDKARSPRVLPCPLRGGGSVHRLWEG